MKNWTESLTDEEKEQVWEFIVYTVTEIRDQIARDIEATVPLWEQKGWVKSRRTRAAFAACAAIARGQNEVIPGSGLDSTSRSES
jgi:hypothetical protein